MSITVRELLQLPHLRLALTAGADGLDRQVSWVHSSDLPNPWEWLGPAELLLTNQTRPKQSETTQVRFLERLAETGASGLGIGLGGAGPPLSARVARRADELALPLVAVPYSVPFTAVARAVADANGRGGARPAGRVARAAGPGGTSCCGCRSLPGARDRRCSARWARNWAFDSIWSTRRPECRCSET